MKWFKIYGERWFMGTTRWELTAEQRAVWVDLLARASINDPPGQVDYYSLGQLAQQFNVDLELLESTIKRCVEEKKIKYFENKRKILISNWKKYQSEYQRQKPYRKGDKSQSKVTEKRDNSCNKVTCREEEEEKKLDLEENRKEDSSETSPQKFSDTDIRLTNLLIEKILENDPKSSVQRMTQKTKKAWLNECRKLREIYDRTPEEIEAVICWCQRDNFEKTVVLSMPKLRKRFDELWLKYEGSKTKVEHKSHTPEERDWIAGEGKYKNERE